MAHPSASFRSLFKHHPFLSPLLQLGDCRFASGFSPLNVPFAIEVFSLLVSLSDILCPTKNIKFHRTKAFYPLYPLCIICCTRYGLLHRASTAEMCVNYTHTKPKKIRNFTPILLLKTSTRNMTLGHC